MLQPKGTSKLLRPQRLSLERKAGNDLEGDASRQSLGTGIILFLDLGGSDTTNSKVCLVEIHLFCAYPISVLAFFTNLTCFSLLGPIPSHYRRANGSPPLPS